MKRNKKKMYITIGILLIVFTVIMFALPFSKTVVFGLAYVFGMFAIIAQIYFLRIAFENGEDAKSKFYGFPIAKIGMLYLVIQLILSLIECIMAAFLPIWAVVAANVLPIGIAAVGSVAADTMRDEIVRQDATLIRDLSNMRNLQSESLALVDICQDEQLKSDLQKLADDFRYSDPVSSESTKEIEEELKEYIGKIQELLRNGNITESHELCEKAKACLKRRNQACRLGK